MKPLLAKAVAYVESKYGLRPTSVTDNAVGYFLGDRQLFVLSEETMNNVLQDGSFAKNIPVVVYISYHPKSSTSHSWYFTDYLGKDEVSNADKHVAEFAKLVRDNPTVQPSGMVKTTFRVTFDITVEGANPRIEAVEKAVESVATEDLPRMCRAWTPLGEQPATTVTARVRKLNRVY